MSNVKKRIEELDLMDDFLFTEASTDSETAPLLMRLIIERATGVKVGKMNIEPQKTVNRVDTDCHGIRMDVTVREVTDVEGKTIRLFDVEPNNIKEVHLPKRSRYYQALTDVKLLETGVDYASCKRGTVEKQQTDRGEVYADAGSDKVCGKSRSGSSKAGDGKRSKAEDGKRSKAGDGKRSKAGDGCSQAGSGTEYEAD